MPTLGDRPTYLDECLKSIQSAGYDVVCIVSPETQPTPILSGVTVIHLKDPGRGVAAAINIGFTALIEGEGCRIVAWLGDDDAITSHQLSESLHILSSSGAVAVVGSCEYVNVNEEVIFTSSPRRKDVCFLEYWSNRLPQPGSIYLSRAVIETGFLDENLKYAFDQDLFHKLKRIGRIAISRSVLAKYRWHSESLSSSGRVASALESQKLRLKYGFWVIKPFTVSWFFCYRVFSRWITPTLP